MIHLEDNPDIRKQNAEISFLLFALGGFAGLLNLTTTLPFGSGFESVAIATNLAHHGTFANPLLVLPSGPTALAPPLYPALLALFMKVLPSPSYVLLVAALGDVIMNAVTAALLPRISWLFFGEVGPGIAAAILWIMSAQLIPSWDANYTVTALLLFCLYSAVTLKKQRVVLFGVSTGALGGIVFLLNPMTLLVFVPWLVHLLGTRKVPLRQRPIYRCIVLLTVVATATPWIVRNRLQLGAYAVRTGLGLNLYVSNNDCSSTSLIEDLHSGCAAIYQPNFSLTEARAFRDLGEVNYDRQRLAMAKAWMRAHPKRFLSLTFSRFLAFWFPRRAEHPFQATVIWIFTVLSLPGLVLMVYRRIAVTPFISFTLLVYPLVYYVIFSDVRFRYPVLWLSLLPAGYFLQWLLKLARDKSQLTTAWRKTAPAHSASGR